MGLNYSQKVDIFHFSSFIMSLVTKIVEIFFFYFYWHALLCFADDSLIWYKILTVLSFVEYLRFDHKIQSLLTWVEMNCFFFFFLWCWPCFQISDFTFLNLKYCVALINCRSASKNILLQDKSLKDICYYKSYLDWYYLKN